ncbi:transcriptional repressor NrdR [Streptomyces galilaeus]|uniref:Transcriptional repressor NrdR n=1 Tax=Streptomyces bobili TaxID=67280 RepID=A0ABZ1QXL1_9ACTN|nr:MULTISPECIES: transcriptional regulator NrdR [Streptomyces]QEU68530.1 transcriptional repressor NrdR [Streptomyces galilaeus]GGW23059.1 transcriptional repressor NrdR [Streptomyces galilaeus]
MHCPFCRHPDSRVVDSRTTDDGTSIRRRRQCPDCSRRFTTVETCSLMVVKRSGVTEPFSRTKVINGVRKACQGRPVTEDALAQLGQRVEEAVRATGSAELTTHDVGLAILGPLQELDLVAYLRFASVYRAFDSLDDFEAAIAELREAGHLAADDEDRERTDGAEGADGTEGAVAGSREDDGGRGGTVQVPEPAHSAD